MKRKSFYSFITIVLLLSSLISCASSGQTDVETTAPENAIDVSPTLKQAEELFRQRTDLQKLREAVNLLA